MIFVMSPDSLYEVLSGVFCAFVGLFVVGATCSALCCFGHDHTAEIIGSPVSRWVWSLYVALFTLRSLEIGVERVLQGVASLDESGWAAVFVMGSPLLVIAYFVDSYLRKRRAAEYAAIIAASSTILD